MLTLAASQFDVFLTADQNIEFQQNLAALPISVVVLVVRRTRIQAIEPLVPELLSLLAQIPERVLRKVGVRYPCINAHFHQSLKSQVKKTRGAAAKR